MLTTSGVVDDGIRRIAFHVHPQWKAGRTHPRCFWKRGGKVLKRKQLSFGVRQRGGKSMEIKEIEELKEAEGVKERRGVGEVGGDGKRDFTTHDRMIELFCQVLL
jgi:hypothetical protein